MNDQGSMVPKTLKPKAFNISPESKLHQAEEDFSQDIFDFGYLMLLCAVGGLEFFDVNDFAGKLKILLAELEKKPQDKQKYCCLIHNEDLIWSVKLPHPEEDVFQRKPVKVHRNNNNNGVIFDKASSKSTPLISIKDFFVYNNFSKEFLEFLCCCLKFDSTKRSSIPALLSSPFLVKSHIKGPVTSLRELIKISAQWSNNNNLTLKPEHQGASENHLNKLCDALIVVLPNCQQFSASDDNPAKYDILLKLGPGSQKIKDLASELGLTPARVWESISQVLQVFMER